MKRVDGFLVEERPRFDLLEHLISQPEKVLYLLINTLRISREELDLCALIRTFPKWRI
jgi:hypothetical protein